MPPRSKLKNPQSLLSRPLGQTTDSTLRVLTYFNIDRDDQVLL